MSLTSDELVAVLEMRQLLPFGFTAAPSRGMVEGQKLPIKLRRSKTGVSPIRSPIRWSVIARTLTHDRRSPKRITEELPCLTVVLRTSRKRGCSRLWRGMHFLDSHNRRSACKGSVLQALDISGCPGGPTCRRSASVLAVDELPPKCTLRNYNGSNFPRTAADCTRTCRRAGMGRENRCL